eukprot:6143481-Amphidinium_carterae.1
MLLGCRISDAFMCVCVLVADCWSLSGSRYLRNLTGKRGATKAECSLKEMYHLHFPHPNKNDSEPLVANIWGVVGQISSVVVFLAPNKFLSPRPQLLVRCLEGRDSSEDPRTWPQWRSKSQEGAAGQAEGGQEAVARDQ